MTENVLPPATDAASPAIATVVESVKQQLIALLRQADPACEPEIDENASFDLLGLDSMSRVGLVAALEEEYGVALEPTAAYDFVTVGALSHFVWAQVTGNALDEKQLLGV